MIRVLRKSKAESAVLQETKIAQARFASRRFKGYIIQVVSASRQSYGSAALTVWANPLFQVENEQIIGPNGISFRW